MFHPYVRYIQSCPRIPYDFLSALVSAVVLLAGGVLLFLVPTIANGEHETPLLLVGALGEGSFDEGAKRLRKITREIRRHKTSNKHDLPPAAHELTVYLKKTIKGK